MSARNDLSAYFRDPVEEIRRLRRLELRFKNWAANYVRESSEPTMARRAGIAGTLVRSSAITKQSSVTNAVWEILYTVVIAGAGDYVAEITPPSDWVVVSITWGAYLAVAGTAAQPIAGVTNNGALITFVGANTYAIFALVHLERAINPVAALVNAISENQTG